MDKSGGFFYERWGDAPVHSIAAGIFLDVSEIHYFGDIGYRHDDVKTCALQESLQLQCNCNIRNDRFDWVYHGTWGPVAIEGLLDLQKQRIL